MGIVPQIIYDDRNSADYERLIAEFERQGIADYKFWEAKRNKDSVVQSINASHKMIVRWAKEQGLNEVCIFEQDVWFPADDGWKYFLENKPKEFDLYLACTLVLPVEEKRVCGFHCYIVHSKFYDRYLEAKDDYHVDNAMDDLKGDYHFCYPFAALQRPGFSRNNMQIVNYNSIFQDKDVYGKFR